MNHPLTSFDGGEQRGVLQATIELSSGQTVEFLSTHLDAREDDTEWLLSVAEINALAAGSLGLPLVLAGNLNARPFDDPIRLLDAQWKTFAGGELLTHPSFEPDKQLDDKQLDYVMAAPVSRWKIVSVQVLDDDIASDHRPVLMVLELVE